MFRRLFAWLREKLLGVGTDGDDPDDLLQVLPVYRGSARPMLVGNTWPERVPERGPPHDCPSAPRKCHCDLKSISLEDGEKLTQLELDYVSADQCPDCKKSGFEEGPSGGMSQNFRCSNSFCSSRFNMMGPFGIERISNAGPGRDQ